MILVQSMTLTFHKHDNIGFFEIRLDVDSSGFCFSSFRIILQAFANTGTSSLVLINSAQVLFNVLVLAELNASAHCEHPFFLTGYNIFFYEVCLAYVILGPLVSAFRVAAPLTCKLFVLKPALDIS